MPITSRQNKGPAGMWLPRLRFTVRTMMLAVACTALVLSYIGTGTTRLGCGDVNVLLRFRVIDDLDGRPVAGASVRLIREYGAPPLASTITGTDGLAPAVSTRAGATWYSGPFFRQYRCLSFGDTIQVEAEGYRSIDEMLHEYTTSSVYHNAYAPPPIVIRLKRVPESTLSDSKARD
jgi:hypothetical protein